ncbi:hypothetical protein Nepgr_018217 [Nepenthes gracilis]|uniref:Amidase domain-containing protein n=1 Tax=Nepenthes gracilis TaxID=150966 RepID=A0AAD3STB1_NEPGR|nr:hypothetical protein Nepgr_018217 [Nepenthes gracilis]
MAFCPPLIHFLRSTTILSLLLTVSSRPQAIEADKFIIKEATVDEIHAAFRENKLNSRQLVKFYLRQIQKLNPVLRSVIEVNPEALDQADEADRERKREKRPGELLGLHGIPILVKDNIATKDKLNTTAGSYALLGSAVPRDAGVVERLRKAGAIIIGKASLSEWAHFRSDHAPNGWCARSGKGRNPYNLSADPCGSSSGSAISMAANMAAVSLGTETDGSILCPSSYNSVVGIKPTVGLTSRSGVIPISPRQDTVGPICRTVTDAVRVLDAIVGFDELDEATKKVQEYIPVGGYTRFLRLDGLKGKRLGIVRNPFFNFDDGSLQDLAFKRHFRTLRRMGGLLVDKLEIANIDKILASSSEIIALEAEFKLSLNYYLKELLVSPVRTLADVIAFNNKFAREEMIEEYGQALFTASEATNGIEYKVKQALSQLQELSSKGFEKTMIEYELDAIVTPGSDFSTILAIGGFPGINVPAGYDDDGVPFGICFGGLTGSEPKLIEIAYAFEQATKIRKPPEVHFPKKSFI